MQGIIGSVLISAASRAIIYSSTDVHTNSLVHLSAGDGSYGRIELLVRTSVLRLMASVILFFCVSESCRLPETADAR